MTIDRRRVLAGIGASGVAALPSRRAQAQQGAPAEFSQIDVDKAKAEGSVSLYTSLDTQIVDAINAGFTQKYGIKVQYFRGGAYDVTGKVLAEADSRRPQADVVDASDLSALMLMKERGLLRPFKSESSPAIAKGLQDPDGTWIADRLTHTIIQINTDEFGKAPPKTWEDITKAGMNNRLVYFSAPNGDGAPRLYTLAQYFGWDLLKKIAATKPLRVQTPQVITQVLERGERGIGVLQNDNIAMRSKLQGKPSTLVFPPEGVPVELGAVGILKSSARPHAAALFFEWWMGKEGQAILAKGGKYSSRGDVAPPEGQLPISQFKSLPYDYADYKKNRAKAHDRLADIFGGEWGN